MRRVVTALLLLGIYATGAIRTAPRAAEGNAFDGVATSPAAPRLDRTFRVMTFNIHSAVGADGRQDLDRVRSVLEGCDFVGLNEVRGRFPWQRHHQAELLGRPMGVQWLFAPTERKWWNDYFGNAVLTRLPVRHWERTPLAGSAGRGYRNVVLTEVEVAGTSVHLLTTHIDRTHDRQPQLSRACELFLALPGPAVLMGDLNTTAEDPTLAGLRSRPGVEDAVPTPPEYAATRVDWLFTRGLRPVRSGLIDRGASDHPAVWAELELPE